MKLKHASVFIATLMLQLTLLFSSSQAQWELEIITDGGATANEWAIADLDGDGDPDLTYNLSEGLQTVWYENRLGDWENHYIDNLNHAQVSGQFAFDLDQDGDQDIIHLEFTSPSSLSWYENILDGMFFVKQVVSDSIGFLTNMAANIADIDGDGDLDVAIGDNGNGLLLWFENSGNSLNWTQHNVASFSAFSARWVTLMDIDGDHDSDIVASVEDTMFSYENQLPATTWPRSVIAPALANSVFGKGADIDNDGDPDLVTYSSDENRLVWFENPSWALRVIADDIPEAFLGPIGDLDNDGDLDVVFSQKDGLGWVENRDNGADWQVTMIDTVPGVFTFPLGIADENGLGDFNQDGRLDVAAVTTKYDLRWYANPFRSPPGTIRVPQDYPTIQDGINAASDGDTVFVADSTYFENINFKGKKITVASYFIMDGDTSHINNTIIDGSQPGHPDSASVVYFVSEEDTNSVLSGFTITGGGGTLSQDIRSGGGIYCTAGATIRDNWIVNNAIHHTADGYGGGIYTGGNFTGIGNNSYVYIEHNIIRNNSIRAGRIWGGGMWFSANGRIVGNLIEANTLSASDSWTSGAGIACQSPSQNDRRDVVIADNVIHRNLGETQSHAFGSYGAGVDAFYSNLIIENNEIIENTVSSPAASFGPAMRLVYTQNAQVTQNTMASNKGIGNDATNAGAILLVYTNYTRIRENIIEGNSGTWGGAILDYETSVTLIENNRLINNTATQDGGAISSSSPSFISNNLIAGNTAGRGGAIDLSVATSERARNLNVSAILGKTPGLDNEAIKMSAPSSTASQVPLVLQNNTIVNNSVSIWGSAIHAVSGTQLSVSNSILYFNKAPLGEQIFETDATISVEYSDVQGGYTGTGNLDADPMFADTLDYYLSLAASPAMDAGNPDPSFNDPEDLNNAGNACFPALGTLTNDMGAYGGPGVICVDSITVGIDVENGSESIPERFVLYQNHPNPFNPSTTIEFDLPQAAQVKLTIYNALGQQVGTLFQGKLNAGPHRYVWQTRDLPSGLYFYRLSGRGFVKTRKMLLLR